ncbi:MAG: radical SAM protein [Nanoarchaeota archaeon]
MRIYFVIPPAKGILEKPTSPHMGIAYLAAIVREKGNEVGILDMRLGYETSELISKVAKFKADYVCITSVAMEHQLVYNIISALKDKSYKVIIGGPHVSSIKKKVLSECRADLAVKGEGEEPIIKILENEPLSTIKGVIWRDGKNIVENQDNPFIRALDEMPFPAFELFELNKYMDKKLPIITSRSCPYRCTFCSINLTMGFGFRPRTAESVVDELEHWYKIGYKYFGFNDDNFTLIPSRAEKICDLIVERGIKIKWELRNGIRIDRVYETLLRKMKSAGCIYVGYGVESFYQDVLDNIKKDLKVEKVKDAILLTDKVGIKKGAFFIIGLPGDTLEKFKQTMKQALELPLDEVRFYNAIPYPGTELYNWVEKNGKWAIKPEVYLNDITSFDDRPVFETDDFSIADRIEATKIAQSYVMKYLMTTEFGRFMGTMAWYLWRPNITRKYVFNAGRKVWTYFRMIKTRLPSLASAE